MQMPGWMKHTLESRLLGEISITLDMQMILSLQAESEEELKSLLMKVKEGSEKAGLKHNIQKPWQIDGETVETVTDFILGRSKITADGGV